MTSILDHVQDSLPRQTVYGAMKGSNVFLGKFFREINPSSNETEYSHPNKRKISFVLASPDKLAWHDMRSAYLKFNLGVSNGTNSDGVKISEPAGNTIIDRIVIRMN